MGGEQAVESEKPDDVHASGDHAQREGEQLGAK
jgi:hypothetical protein